MPPKRRTGGGNPTTTTTEPDAPPNTPSGVSSASEEPAVTVEEMTAAETDEAEARWEQIRAAESEPTSVEPDWVGPVNAVNELHQRHRAATTERLNKLIEACNRLAERIDLMEDAAFEPTGVDQRRVSALAVPQPGAVFAAMWEVMRDVQGVGKHGQMDPSSRLGDYKYRRYDDLKLALGAACRAHGIMLQSRVLNVVNERVGREGAMTRVQVTVMYRFTSLADGTEVTFESVGEAFDRGDKATSKAMTMALKTCLDQAFMLAAEDVEDPDASRPVADVAPPERPPAPPVTGQRIGTDNGPRDQSDPWDQGPPPDSRTPQQKAQAAADKASHPRLTLDEWTKISDAAKQMELMELPVRVNGSEMALKHHLVAVGRTL